MSEIAGRYLMRCAKPGCEYRQRTSVNPLEDGWPTHCGLTMRFATTFDEERFQREIEPAMDKILGQSLRAIGKLIARP
jgi:hypothetical protein